MKKLYYANPYLKEAEGTVVKVIPLEKNLFGNFLDETIFYGESGGQKGDRGFLGDEIVLETRKGNDGESLLITKKPLEQGKKYIQKLDWDYRYSGMVDHTAQHLISGLLYKIDKIGTVSVHMHNNLVSIETDKAYLEDSFLFDFEDLLNNEILNSHLVSSNVFDRNHAESLNMRRSIKVNGNEIRIVKIEDCDVIACGGIHVNSTSEILRINYLGQEKIRGHVRIFFNIGKTAVLSDKEDRNKIRKLCQHFSCKKEEIFDAIEKNEEKFDAIKFQLANISQEYAKEIIEKNSENGIVTFVNKSLCSIEDFSKAVQKIDELALFIIQKEENRIKWMIALKGKWENSDFNFIRKNILPIINGKGGGKSILFQGIGDCTDLEKIEYAFCQFKERTKLN